MSSKSSNSSSRGSESGLSKTLSVDLEIKRQEAETLECQKREMHDRQKTVRKKEAARIRQGKGKVLLIFNSN